MKILLLQSAVYVPTHGGENKANRLLLEGLAERGHSCHVVAPACGAHGPGTREAFLGALAQRGLAISATRDGADVFHQCGVDVHAIGDASRVRDTAIRRMREIDPTWTLVSSADPGQLLLEAALDASPSRVVYLAHTMLFFPFGPHGYLIDTGKAELFRRTAGIITVSEYLKAYIRRWGRCDSTVIPFPVYGSGPFPTHGDFTKGFATLINPCAYKGLSIFLAVAQQLPEVPFAAVPTWGTTTADRRALEQQRNIAVVGPFDSIDKVFVETRVLLAPSLWGEGFPLVTVEAMLRGIPVVASNTGGLPEAKLGVDYVLPVRAIERYEHRFDDRKLPIPLIPEQDVQPWIETVRTLVCNRQRYERVANASRRAALVRVRALDRAVEDYLEGLPARSRPGVAGMTHRTENDGVHRGELLRQIEGLSAERRALLAMRVGATRARTPDSGPTRHEDPTEPAPLSFAQERLWFLNQWNPESAVYNNVDAFRLTGYLDLDALTSSLNAILARHAVLRTTIGLAPDGPIQRIASQARMSIDLVHVAGGPDHEQEAEVLRLARAEARRPFDLIRGPLLRTLLLRLGPQEHLLVVTMHHIVADGWSFGLFLNELGAHYNSVVDGVRVSLPALPIQYPDVARWQRQQLQSTAFERQLAYWQRQLAGAPAVLELPTDRPRPGTRRFEGARQTRRFSKDLTSGLKHLSRDAGATLFMTLLTAFQALLNRAYGQDDVVVGTPIAGRSLRSWKASLGHLPIRWQCVRPLRRPVASSGARASARDGDRGLRASGHAVRKAGRGTEPERTPTHAPIVQVLFALQNTPPPALATHRAGGKAGGDRYGDDSETRLDRRSGRRRTTASSVRSSTTLTSSTKGPSSAWWVISKRCCRGLSWRPRRHCHACRS